MIQRCACFWSRSRSGSLVVALVLAVAALASPKLASAQSGTWTAAAGSTGLWSGSTNWSGGIVANGSGNTATFTNNSSGTSTTTLDSNRMIGGITVSSTGVRAIDGPGFTLTLATGSGTPTLSGTTNSALGITAVIAGTQGFRKTGTSTLALFGANTFSGTALLQTGTTVIRNVDGLGAFGAGNETVLSSGAQLRFEGITGTVSESISIAGRGNPTNVDDGSGGAIRVLGSTVTLAGGITLTGTINEIWPNSSSNLTIAGNITGGGPLLLRPSGALSVSGNMSHAGSITRVSGGTGLLTLSGSNSYTGSTAIDNGPAKLDNPYAIPTTSRLSVTAGGALDLNGNDVTIPTFGWRDDGASPLVIGNSSGGTIFDDSISSGTTTITVTSGSFVLGTGINDGSNGRKVALKIAAGGGADLSRIELQNQFSNFSGGLTILNGPDRGTRLRVEDPLTNTGAPGAIAFSVLGTGTVTVGLAPTDKAQFYMGPGTYTEGVGGSTVLNDFVFNTAVGADAASGVLLNTREATFAGTLVAGQASISIARGSLLSGTGVVAVLTGRVTSTGANGGLRLVGNGQVPGIEVRLANETGAPNDYQGPTTVDAGTTLVLGAADQVPNGAGKGNVSVAGTVNLGGFSDTINGLTGSGVVEAGGGTPTLTVGDGDATASFGGVLRNTSGVLSLVKIGSGSQALTGANTLTGPTTVSQGTLQLATSNALSSSAVTVAAGATLSVGPQVAATIPSLVNNGLVDVGLGGLTVTSGQTAEGIVAAIIAGRADGLWTGTSGITSSAAATQSERAVGWLNNGDGSFTVAFGAAGDWNLNGVVDFDDVVQFVSANLYDTGLPATWAEGDYDYNGVVDFDDVVASVSANLFDAGPYNTGPGGLSALGFGGDDLGLMSGGFTAVPEPAASVLLAAGLAAWGIARLQRRSAGGSDRSSPA
jgi:fibronectin-binding autotransporter adhesin